jgi:hypothetical protein
MAAAAQYIPPEQEDVQTFSTNCGSPFIDEAAKQAGGDASVDVRLIIPFVINFRGWEAM